jgi:PAS domain S-box-containing protein
MENTAEIKRLQSCINDLISVLALPAIWSGSESSQILGTLLDVLLTILRLDFAYARLIDASDGSPIEVVRLGDHQHSSIQPQQSGQALGRWLTGGQTVSRSVIPVLAGEAEVSIASFSLGLQHDGGVLVAGSRRTDFPTEVERLLLRVAANQAGIGLQEARRSGEQKRIAEMLEQRVAERTRSLTAVNDELQRSEAYLEEAQRLSHTGSFGWKVSTGDIIWSEETFRIFQYERTTKPTVELILQRVHPEDEARVQETIEQASQDGKDFEHEYRLVIPDGSIKYVHVVAYASSDESGSIEFVGAVMDITERRRAEKALRQSESHLAEAQRLAHTGSWVWSVPERDALYLSDEWYRIYGFNPEEGMPTWEERLQRIHPEDRAEWEGTFDRAVVGKSEYEVEFRVLLPDGTVKYIHAVGHPVLNTAGDLMQFVGSSMDITDRKRAEMLLAGEKRLLEMIARRDSRAAILDALCRLVEELASGSMSSVLMLDPNTNRLRHGAAPSLPISYADAIDGIVIGPSVGSCGTAAYRAERVIVSDIAADQLWANFRDLALAHGLRACWSTPILSSEGKVLGTFATYYREPRNPTPQEHHVIERITHLASIAIEGEQAEEALRQAQADLARVSRVTTMGELTASLAHEVNQPIAAAVTDANTCIRWLTRVQPDLEEAREAASRVVKDATRAANIISRIRSHFKKGAPDRELVDVNEVVREILALLRSEATRYSISVRTELAADLPLVTADRVQLQQVMMNLIMNSIDAMKAVDETRELTIQSQQTANEQLLVTVTDTGMGLPTQQTDQIFNAFFTTKLGGTGMGLRISRSILESHGGRLWAAPNSPRGASFYFTLPTQDEAHE